MSNESCGLIIGEGRTISILNDSSYAEISWDKVSEEFKADFVKEYKESIGILDSDLDINIGLNSMAVLDYIGWMINSGEVTKEDKFKDIEEKAIATLVEAAD